MCCVVALLHACGMCCGTFDVWLPMELIVTLFDQCCSACISCQLMQGGKFGVPARSDMDARTTSMCLIVDRAMRGDVRMRFGEQHKISCDSCLTLTALTSRVC